MKTVLLRIDSCDKTSNITKAINVLDAIMYIQEAFIYVKKETIEKCFRNCGFLNFSCRLEHDVSGVIETEDLGELQTLMNQADGFDSYDAENNVSVDNDIATECTR